MMTEHQQAASVSVPYKLFGVFCLLLILVISIYSLFYFLKEKVYYYDSDVFYYLSIADSLEQNGQLLDLSLVPPQSPKTPQNAVVLLHYFLAKFFPSAELRLQILVVLNAIMLWISLYPLLKIAGFLDITSWPARLALSAVYLGGWHMLRFQFAPINDGLFRTGSLWLICWILSMDSKERGLKELWIGQKPTLLAGCLLAAALIHFRLNAMIIPLGACPAALFLKRKSTGRINFLLLSIMVVSLVLPYSFIGLTRIQHECQYSWYHILQQLPKHVWNFANGSLPEALLRDLGTAGNVLYAGFVLALLLSALQGIRQRRFSILLIVLICLGTFAFLFLYYAAPYRMLLMIYPLLYILILRERCLRPIGYLFVFAVLMQSCMLFYSGIGERDTIRFWTYVSHEIKADKTDYLLITDTPRQAYYFSGVSGLYKNEYEWDDLLAKKNIYLAGSESFLQQHKEQISRMVEQNDQSFESENLTEEYTDPSGHAFVRITIQKE